MRFGGREALQLFSFLSTLPHSATYLAPQPLSGSAAQPLSCSYAQLFSTAAPLFASCSVTQPCGPWTPQPFIPQGWAATVPLSPAALRPNASPPSSRLRTRHSTPGAALPPHQSTAAAQSLSRSALSPLPLSTRGRVGHQASGNPLVSLKGMASGARGDKATIDLVELLGCCVSACQRAGHVIRVVERKRRNSATGSIEGAVLKDAEDPRSYLTEADTAAQRVIMKTLRESFPELTIIGEEEDTGSDGDVPLTDFKESEHKPLEGFGEVSEEMKTCLLSEVCVFVDPVDGTKEFVEGRLGAVQTLIGISLRGRSVAGAVGIPFLEPFEDGSESEVHVMYGILGGGVRNVPAPTGERPSVDGKGSVLVASPSAKEQAVALAKQILSPAAIITPGGVGNKILSVLRGDADCALMHLSTSLWDTCATEALIRAQGGRMSTLTGEAIDHSPAARVLNVEGVFVSCQDFAEKDAKGRSHEQLCQEWQARDILNSKH